MINDFENRLSMMTDLQLMKIIKSPKGDYQSLALEKAIIEFKSRCLSQQEIRDLENLIEMDDKEKNIKSNTTLDIKWKVLTFIFPGIIQIIYSGIFISQGYEKKAKEMVKWTIFGFIFYLLFFIILNTIFF